MSGKLIMKRKRASQEEQLQQQQQQQHQQQQQQQDEEPAPEKRHRPLTPPAEDPSEDQASRPDSANRILLEALQKIMELQSELDAFEQDLDERDAAAAGREDPDADSDTDPEDAEVAAQFAPAPAATPAQRSQAEALGFAMCARETLLFLQSEGVPTESPLYQTLLGKLVGQSDGLLNA
ncbi:THAP domain-containing protein 11 [Drosophila serrata]|uniref:THAP domain-containing protein 11 n=1 Tax=Drosophila serrata TaxID=7274 RepID=UPI000A1D17EE|nr:THAP domain-containing protein 11 [Drosophila serrata]